MSPPMSPWLTCLVEGLNKPNGSTDNRALFPAPVPPPVTNDGGGQHPAAPSSSQQQPRAVFFLFLEVSIPGVANHPSSLQQAEPHTRLLQTCQVGRVPTTTLLVIHDVLYSAAPTDRVKQSKVHPEVHRRQRKEMNSIHLQNKHPAGQDHVLEEDTWNIDP